MSIARFDSLGWRLRVELLRVGHIVWRQLRAGHSIGYAVWWQLGDGRSIACGDSWGGDVEFLQLLKIITLY